MLISPTDHDNARPEGLLFRFLQTLVNNSRFFFWLVNSCCHTSCMCISRVSEKSLRKTFAKMVSKGKLELKSSKATECPINGLISKAVEEVSNMKTLHNLYKYINIYWCNYAIICAYSERYPFFKLHTIVLLELLDLVCSKWYFLIILICFSFLLYQKYDNTVCMQQYKGTSYKSHCSEALNVLYTYNRTYEPYLVHWLFPLQIAFQDIGSEAGNGVYMWVKKVFVGLGEGGEYLGRGYI